MMPIATGISASITNGRSTRLSIARSPSTRNISRYSACFSSMEEKHAEYLEMLRVLGDRAIESLVDLPLVIDAEIPVAMGIMIKLGLASYYTDQTLYQA